MKTSIFTVLLFGVFIIILAVAFLFFFELLFRLGQQLMEKSNALEEEIAQRQAAQSQAETSLWEKELLLKEIHHRVKNNMQIISSLLRMQARRLGDARILEIINESRSRIGAIALVHKALYGPGNLSSVSLHEYVQELTTQLFDFYAVEQDRITLSTDVETISLNIETATPCGLIINELVTNSFKYAFPGDRKGEITVSLKRNGQGGYLLRVADNGVGLPAGFDIRSGNSLGLQLVVNLAEHQLQGRLEVTSNGGTSFAIAFKETGYVQRI
ncbi:sensor histidine kinase [Thiovibrio sp. JS02]